MKVGVKIQRWIKSRRKWDPPVSLVESVLDIQQINGETFVSASDEWRWPLLPGGVVRGASSPLSHKTLPLLCRLLTRKWSDGRLEAKCLHDGDKQPTVLLHPRHKCCGGIFDQCQFEFVPHGHHLLQYLDRLPLLAHATTCAPLILSSCLTHFWQRNNLKAFHGSYSSFMSPTWIWNSIRAPFEEAGPSQSFLTWLPLYSTAP